MEAFEILEEKFAAWAGVQNPVACCNGTAALHLALEALHLPLGSEILIPEFTMVACARAAALAGLTPVFVDCGDDLLVDLELLERSITAKTRAVMAVHVYGRAVNMEVLHQIANNYRLKVVEDLAEAHGLDPHPRSDAACWSFYKNKIIAGEEGGLAAFLSKSDAARAKMLRCQGFNQAHDFTHLPRAHNYRLANCCAALILESLRHVTTNIKRRRQVESWYQDVLPAKYHMPARDVPWVYDLRIPGLRASDQDRLVRRLNRAGVAARHGFKPMSAQPEFARAYRHLRAWTLAQEVIYLPITPALSKDEVQVIAEQFLSEAESLNGL